MNIKELFGSKKGKTYIIFGMLAAVLIIVLVVVVTSLGGNSTSNYSQLEERLVSAAKNYYSDNTDRLPVEVGNTIKIDDVALTSGGYLKAMSKISPKGSTCSGIVEVTNTNGNFNYTAYLDCGESYKTVSIADYIRDNSLTVTTGDGLYSNNGDLVYRGEFPDNYINFAGRVYRIVSVNKDDSITIIATDKTKSTIKTVWDDRYNTEKDNNYGINDYTVSRIRDSLLEYLNGTSFTDSDRTKLQSTLLCIGKVSEKQEIVRNVECSSTYDNQVIGVLPLSNYVYASLDNECKNMSDRSCQNYNYLALADYNWWSLTGLYDNTYQVFNIQSGGSVNSTRASSNGYIREVLTLSSSVSYVSGNGTSKTPFVIK